MQTRVQNRLADLRKSRGVGAADLARRAGVTRQTIYAIEAGTYVPNTEVTLRLARTLEVTVEEMFSLPFETDQPPERIAADVLSNTPPVKGQAVRLCQVGSRWVSIPVTASPYYLPDADGIAAQHSRIKGKTNITPFGKDEEATSKKLVLAGCDPATNLLASTVEKMSGVEIIAAAASSKLALSWLREGKVHIAGSHLEDSETGEFNLPFIKREFPQGDFAVVTLAHWEQGLVVAKGNPKSIRSIDHLAKKNVRFVNREPGSGSRAFLDQLLRNTGIVPARVHGYKAVASGHLAAAYRIFADEADCCLATRSAAQVFGLDFVPLHLERYDLVMRKQTLQLPATQAFLNVLQRSALRRKLAMFAGYDTAQTGAVLA